MLSGVGTVRKWVVHNTAAYPAASGSGTQLRKLYPGASTPIEKHDARHRIVGAEHNPAMLRPKQVRTAHFQPCNVAGRISQLTAHSMRIYASITDGLKLWGSNRLWLDPE